MRTCDGMAVTCEDRPTRPVAPEVAPEAHLEAAGERTLEHVLIEQLEFLVELLHARVRLRHDRADVTHHVAKHGRAHQHRDHCEATLDIRVGCNVAWGAAAEVVRRPRSNRSRDGCLMWDCAVWCGGAGAVWCAM
jgi:hypothetical protein